MSISTFAPGVQVTETLRGLIPAELARHDRVYLLGSGAGGGDGAPDLYATPTQISSLDDAVTRFGVGTSSTTGASVGLLFDIIRGAIVFFTRVPIGTTHTITVTAVGDDSDTIVVNAAGTDFTYSIDTATDTDVAMLATNLIAAINDENSAINATVVASPGSTADTIAIRWADPSAPGIVTVTPTGNAAATVTTDPMASAPSLADYLWTIETAFDPDEHSQGYLCAPEAFASLTEQSDRTALRTAMANFCSFPGFDWVALIDGYDGNTPQKMDAEAKLYTSPLGHATLPFFPDLITLAGIQVPPSAGVAGVALKRMRQEGFIEPPAGGLYPLPIAGLSQPVTQNEFSAYFQNVNFIRKVPKVGFVVKGSRTRASDPRVLFINGRVITNIAIGTLRDESLWNTVVFSAVDGQGVLAIRAKSTITNIFYRMWRAGALYGANPRDAFGVLLGDENNELFDVQTGQLNADCFIATVPTLERFKINIFRTALGQVQVELDGFSRSRSLF